MIPVKLLLNNFMCYRDNVPPLSFDGIHIACLCGDNGNGKSAIFDALTWALWGKSRAKNDDDLIYLGQSEMEVELEFRSGEQRYRVIRKHAKKPSKSRAGQTVLELQIADNGAFKSVSGNSLLETQQKIIDMLSLDYETFKNSAFLRQGHADEFSVKRPGERKEVLANILGLSHYDELESSAKEEAVKRRSEADKIGSSIAEIEAQLADRAGYEETIGKIQAEIGQIEAARKSQEASVSRLRSRKESLEIKQEQLVETEARLNEAKVELEELQTNIAQRQSRISEYQKILTDKQAIEQGFSDLTDVKKLNNEFNQTLSRLFALRERASNLDQVIKKAAQALIIEHNVTQDRFTKCETKFAAANSLEESLTQARKQILELSAQEEIVAEKRNQIQETLSRISYLESTSVQLAAEIGDLDEKLKLLTGEDVHCPLCQTELGAAGRDQLQARLLSEREQQIGNQKENYAEISREQVKRRALEGGLSQQELELNKERTARHSRLSIIEKELAEARAAGQEFILERARLEELEQRLSKKDYAADEQQMLAQLENEEQMLGYSKEKHEYVQGQLLALEKYETMKQRLDEAVKNIDSERSALSEADETVSRLKRKIDVDTKKQQKLAAELISLPDITNKLTNEESALQKSLDNERQVRDSLAALQERLSQLAALEVKKQEKAKLLIGSLNEETIFKELAEAFGKKGIQALLIEQSLPEIEIEANRLLAKMTDNRMSLRLESQRETKKGDTIETLDIKIADELGTRNYEMYSGGEAFRIDLALRIALSRLLVRRAGASLPILIIDEGFGTQDSSARERLIDAINSIQDDFEKIIVITHLEEMKDKFETLITVTKTTNGSTISVS
ncbi:MAG TPA: SMC family ATPase [Dehalococcoidia bacterium]